MDVDGNARVAANGKRDIGALQLARPIAICQPFTAQLDANGTVTINPSDVDGGSSDPNGGSVTLSLDNDTFTCADIGPNTVTLTVTNNDSPNSTATCTAIVTVEDNVPPTITCPSNQVGSVDTSCLFTLPDYTGLATVADNCTASPTVTQVPAPGTQVTVGTTNIVLTATDLASNTATCNFDVVVSDTTPPTITCPADQIGSVDTSCLFTLPDYTGLATAADNCFIVDVTQVPAPGTQVTVGTTNIVLTATDLASNTATCNFDVVVSDTTPPTITCPADQIGSVDTSCLFTLPDYTGLATAADNCFIVDVTQVPLQEPKLL